MLSVFEAAARRGSFSAAAEELCLSQSAVSRQIKCLESQLEHNLFIRDRGSVRVTEAGERYASSIRDALSLIATASINLRASPVKSTLNLAVDASLGARWLVPQLSEFLELNPNVKVNLNAITEPFDLRKENIDAAICFGDTRLSHAEARFLMKEKLVPVCSAGFLKKYPIDSTQAILDIPLLHVTSRPDAWERWLRFMDVEFDFLTGIMTNQFDIAINAAQYGMGLALVPELLILQELEEGSLVSPLNMHIESEGSYSFVWSSGTGQLEILIKFYDWLIGKACLGVVE
ncbi:LysR substrate-binding domain-containing protein [Kineobactrum salinum]|nr:LysR substrate-binding domain-containing protein [Kineobactrum salinum]